MKLNLYRPNKLYRYSEKKWLDRSLHLGEFRLRPASDYKNMEKATSRTDDEQHRKVVLRNPDIIHYRTNKPIIPLGDVIKSSEIHTDYLVLCFSIIYSNHFYKDFVGSDACLVIHNPNEFFDRLYRKINSVVPTTWGATDGPVSYGSSSKLGVPFTKPDKFIFQFEWRFVCLPIPSLNKCEPILTSIGSIEDIAKVITP